MEPISVGVWSIVPPIIAITLALATKDVISSLLIGITSGTVIYVLHTSGNIVTAVDYTFTIMANEFNAMMIMFMAILGALVAVITIAGGSRAYGNWAAKKVKSPVGAQLATSVLGIVIFIDDYFNCLTVGTVMRPVTDAHKISREKLAYIIDAMAAPICIIAPVSSWAASVISYMSGTGLEGMSVFISTIPYNIYAILTIVMVFVMSVFDFDFGPMAKFQRAAQTKTFRAVKDHSGSELADAEVSERGRVYDLIIPILALIIFSVLGMLYTGGYFKGGISITEGFGNTDATKALVLGGFAALLIAFVLFVPRRVLTFTDFMNGIVLGVKSMVTACIILALAWTIKGVCTVLSTGSYVSHIVESSNMPIMFIPAIVFLVAALLSFSIGTSWGTFGILIPIIVVVCQAVAPDMVVLGLAATLAGSIFGDHCSPISDTTILSSTGAGCRHIDHVASQLPYATLVAACSLVGYIIAGFTKSLPLSLGIPLVMMLAALKFLHSRDVKKKVQI